MPDPAAPAATPAPAATADPAAPAPAATPAPAAAPVETSLLGGKAPDAKPADGAKPADAPAAEIKLALPQNTKLTQADVDRVSLFAKTNGLNQKQADGLLADEAKVADERTKAEIAQVTAARQKAFADNMAALKADPEIGGEKMARAVESAKIALAKAPASIQDLVSNNPIGNHPDLIRWLAKMGEGMREDPTLSGGTGGTTKPPEQPIANRWYPKPAAEAAA